MTPEMHQIDAAFAALDSGEVVPILAEQLRRLLTGAVVLSGGPGLSKTTLLLDFLTDGAFCYAGRGTRRPSGRAGTTIMAEKGGATMNAKIDDSVSEAFPGLAEHEREYIRRKMEQLKASGAVVVPSAASGLEVERVGGTE